MKRLVVLLTVIMLTVVVGMLFVKEPARAGTESTVRSIELPLIPLTLKPGSGVDKTTAFCNICHSLEYITMQPAFPRATWTAEVNKMIKVMGAPISDEDAKTIIEYLTANYGTGS